MKISTKGMSIAAALFALLCANPAISSVTGITVDAAGSINPAGIQNSTTGVVKYYIPLSERNSGVYGVSDTPTCGTGGANTGGAGTCSDRGRGFGYDDAGALDMNIYFDLSDLANKDNAVLDIWFGDLDLFPINDPDWFLESIAVSSKNGGGLLTPFVGTFKNDTDIPDATSDPFTWRLDLASLGTLDDKFWIQLGFGSDSDYYAKNTAEYLKATISAVPVPAAVWLFGTALIGFIGLSRRTSV